MLITSRLRAGLPSLRHAREAARIRVALAAANQRGLEDAKGSPPFQVVHHSIQSNHLHLIVEAADRETLTAGMRGLLVRIARALNRLWGRKGSVFGDRFHERELRNPRQVRNALVYVLQNLRKHGIHLHGPDPLSSGPEFDGWSSTGQGGESVCHAPDALLRAARVDSPPPKTWLLGVGWRRHGLIDRGEHPLLS